MALDGCGLVCKYILIIFNIIFAVVGFAFLGVGLWLRFSNSTRGIFQVEELNNSAFVVAVTVLIVLGTVMLVVVTFGDYGVCSEKRCALNVFSVLLSFMAVATVTVGVLAYSNRDWVGLKCAEFYTSMYGLYVASGDAVIAITLMFIHETLHCCGLTGVSLVEAVQKTCPSPKGFLESIKMDSCPGIIISVFDSKASLVSGIFIGTGVLLVTALVCTIILLRQTKRNQQEVTAYYSAVY